MTPVLELEDVALDVGGRSIIDGVSLSVLSGETLALLGPSGSGKSTLLRLALGLAVPTRGLVKLDGMLVSRPGRVLVPPEERRLAVVFQDLALWPHLTVAEHLDFALASLRLPGPERSRRIAGMLERVSLTGKERRLPGALSGGERQRVAIARALVVEPRALLLDEPLASLDVALRQEMLSLFRSVLAERGATTVFVTHDLREATRLADRAVVIESGIITGAGPVARMASLPQTPFIRALVDDLAAGRE